MSSACMQKIPFWKAIFFFSDSSRFSTMQRTCIALFNVHFDKNQENVTHTYRHRKRKGGEQKGKRWGFFRAASRCLVSTQKTAVLETSMEITKGGFQVPKQTPSWEHGWHKVTEMGPAAAPDGASSPHCLPGCPDSTPPTLSLPRAKKKMQSPRLTPRIKQGSRSWKYQLANMVQWVQWVTGVLLIFL